MPCGIALDSPRARPPLRRLRGEPSIRMIGKEIMKEHFMRYVSIFALCLFALAVPRHSLAAELKTYGEGGVSISIPNTWKVFDQNMRDQVMRNSGGGKVLLLAEAPAPEFLKITVAEAPAGMNGLTSAILGEGTDEDIRKMCKGYIDMVNKAGQGKDPACGRAKIGKLYAVATSQRAEAEGPRPALGNSTWIFPRGGKSTVVTFLYKPGEKTKHQKLMQRILSTLVPGPDTAPQTPENTPRR